MVNDYSTASVTDGAPSDTAAQADRARLAHLAAVVDASSDAILSKTLDGVGHELERERRAHLRLQGRRDDREEHPAADPRRSAGRGGRHPRQAPRRPVHRALRDRATDEGRAPLDVSLSISPVKDATGRIVGASKIIRDITARKRADEALVAANAKFESVFNQSGIFAGIMDLDGDLHRGQRARRRVVRIHARGGARPAVLGDALVARLGGDAGAHPRGDRSGAAGDVFRETLTYWVADGTERIVDFAMHPIRDELGDVRFLHPTGIDITEREHAEQRFRSLVSIVTDVPWTADSMGRFVAAQPTWGDYTGQSPDEYQGLGWLDAVHPDDQAILWRTAWARATASGDLFQATGRLWHAESGEHRPRRRPRDAGAQSRRRRRRVGRRLHGRPRANARRRGAARAGGGGARDCDRACSGRSCPTSLVSSPRLALAAHYEAGSDVLEVGGDWYDAFQLPDGRIGLTVGDVVGHGLAAAAAMGQLRTALGALAQHAESPGVLLSRLDGFLARTRTTDFATVCYVVLDPATRRRRVRLGRPPADAGSLPARERRPGSTAPSRPR